LICDSIVVTYVFCHLSAVTARMSLISAYALFVHLSN